MPRKGYILQVLNDTKPSSLPFLLGMQWVWDAFAHNQY